MLVEVPITDAIREWLKAFGMSTNPAEWTAEEATLFAIRWGSKPKVN